MTREEVMQMTNDQLKFKCAEILGIEYWREDGNGNYIVLDVPDYPNDIAAAWVLLAAADKAHREYRMAEELFPSVCNFIHYEEGDEPGASDVVSDLFQIDARAITRAFILAMGEK